MVGDALRAPSGRFLITRGRRRGRVGVELVAGARGGGQDCGLGIKVKTTDGRVGCGLDKSRSVRPQIKTTNDGQGGGGVEGYMRIE